MTGDERLAKVAEVLAGHRVNYHQRNVGGETASTLGYTSCEGGDWLSGRHDEAGWEEHIAEVLKPLLDEFQAEDEARALQEVIRRIERERRETFDIESEATWREAADVVRSVLEGRPLRAGDAALAAAETDAGER